MMGKIATVLLKYVINHDLINLHKSNAAKYPMMYRPLVCSTTICIKYYLTFTYSTAFLLISLAIATTLLFCTLPDNCYHTSPLHNHPTCHYQIHLNPTTLLSPNTSLCYPHSLNNSAGSFTLQPSVHTSTTSTKTIIFTRQILQKLKTS